VQKMDVVKTIEFDDESIRDSISEFLACRKTEIEEQTINPHIYKKGIEKFKAIDELFFSLNKENQLRRSVGFIKAQLSEIPFEGQLSVDKAFIKELSVYENLIIKTRDIAQEKLRKNATAQIIHASLLRLNWQRFSLRPYETYKYIETVLRLKQKTFKPIEGEENVRKRKKITPREALSPFNQLLNIVSYEYNENTPFFN
jgi:hypothetical protein